MCIHAYYGDLRQKKQCKHRKNKKCRFLHLSYGIRVSYFWSGYQIKLLGKGVVF